MKQNNGAEILDLMKQSVFWRRTVIRRHLVLLSDTSTNRQMSVPGIQAISLKMRHLFDVEDMVRN